MKFMKVYFNMLLADGCVHCGLSNLCFRNKVNALTIGFCFIYFAMFVISISRKYQGIIFLVRSIISVGNCPGVVGSFLGLYFSSLNKSIIHSR